MIGLYGLQPPAAFGAGFGVGLVVGLIAGAFGMVWLIRWVDRWDPVRGTVPRCFVRHGKPTYPRPK